MRVSGVVFVSILGLAAIAPAAQAQDTVPESCPQPGYVVAPGPGSEADRNGNDIVCVDAESGEIRDDVDPPDREYDRNHDFIVCYNAEKGVVTDNRLRTLDDEPDSRICPPGFEPWPAIIFF